MTHADLRGELDRRGWAVVRAVVPAAELTAMRAVFTTLVPDVPYPRGRDGVMWEVTGGATYHAPLARISRDPRYGAIAAAALGAARVQLLQDSLLYKPAHDGASVAWHHDHTYVGYLTPPRVVAVRIALWPEDPASGCMRVVDGSHRWGVVGDNLALRATEVGSVEDALSPGQRAELDHAHDLVLDAGDVSVHHCQTLHASGVNRSVGPRMTIILRMFDAACRLDASRLPDGTAAHFPVDADGHLSLARFPCVYPVDEG